MRCVLIRTQCACAPSIMRYSVLEPRPVSSRRSRSSSSSSSSSQSRSISGLCRQQRSSTMRVHATGAGGPAPNSNDSNNGEQPTFGGSDLAFIGKLVVFSAVGAGVIKYGSLLISLPFEPSPLVALGVVLGTPALYSLYLLTQSGQQQQ